VRFTKEGKNPVSLDEFFQAGVHLGHRSSRWEPRMAPFLLGSRKGLDVIDLDKTLSKITNCGVSVPYQRSSYPTFYRVKRYNKYYLSIFILYKHALL